MSHGKTVCSCGALISQCRCIEGHREVTVIEMGCRACGGAWQPGLSIFAGHRVPRFALGPEQMAEANALMERMVDVVSQSGGVQVAAATAAMCGVLGACLDDSRFPRDALAFVDQELRALREKVDQLVARKGARRG